MMRCLRRLMLIGLCFFLSGCSSTGQQLGMVAETPSDTVVGTIGNDAPISRALAAKMLALAFFETGQTEKLEDTLRFSDVSREDWFYPFVNAAVSLGFLAGGEGMFSPQDEVTLEQAQLLIERICPENSKRIVLTEENRTRPISYQLWLELFSDALKQRCAEDTLEPFGFSERELILLEPLSDGAVLTDRGIVWARGIDLEGYWHKKVRALVKKKEIAALLSVTEEEPILRNAYFRQEGDSLLVETGDGAIGFAYTGENLSEGMHIGDLKLAEDALSVEALTEPMGSEVVERVGETLILENSGVLEFLPEARVYEEMGEEVKSRSLRSLLVGTNIADFYGRDGKVAAGVIRRHVIPEEVRVLINPSDGEKYRHKSITLTATEDFSVMGKDFTQDYPAGSQLILTPEEDGGFFAQGRVSVQAKNGAPMIVESLMRAGAPAQYAGRLLLEKTPEGYLMVNALPMEAYLPGVVAAEMPESFGLNALQVQAIAARSYAYNQFYANRFGEYGAHVDDTVNTQAYQGAATNPLALQAVETTEGLGMIYGNQVVNANFFSTSAGVTANSGEVWAGWGGVELPTESKPYLRSALQGVEGDFGDLSKEENMRRFLAEAKGRYDMEAPLYRWEATLSREWLQQSVPKALNEIAAQNLNLVFIQKEDGSWQNAVPGDLGEIQKIEIIRRGEGGNAMELIIAGATQTVRVRTENAIRRVLRPEKAEVIAQTGNVMGYQDILPSGFFVLDEIRTADNTLEGVRILGGGYGHGVGMSQYGAKRMSEEGFSYQEILSHYFPGTQAGRILPSK